MRILVTGHHLEITESLQSHIDAKFEKLARHFDNVTDVHVILSVEKLPEDKIISLIYNPFAIIK